MEKNISSVRAFIRSWALPPDRPVLYVLVLMIHTLRMLTLTEGVSYLLLLGVAMPLKYLAGMPMAVTIVGWLHGVLFVLFSLQLAYVFFRARWSIARGALVFISALVPFGSFVIDRRMREWE